MRNYIQKHWQGDYPLGISFWFNFLLVIIVYHYGENLIRFSFDHSPHSFILSTIVYLIISRLIIYPWQVIGLLRACEQHLLIYGNVIKVRAVQAIVILSLLGTFIHILDSAQSLIIFKKNVDKTAVSQADPTFTLSIVNKGRFILLKGEIDFGVTKAVSQILSTNPDIDGIILDSSGGIVYEGRGLFMLIKKHGLDTYCFKNCRSACTIAFIGGTKRFLGSNARLGFHQYRLDSDKINPVVDIEDEQKKDLGIYKSQMINDTFLNKIFEKSQNEIWFPTHDELLTAGVVDRIVNKVHY
jgi:ATP-dependent protease ClpP protease subunit